MTRKKTKRKPLPGKPKPRKLAHVLELISIEGKKTELFHNGNPIPFEEFNVKEHIELPFAIVELDGKPLFDTEVWVNDELKFLMPEDSQWARDAIASFENIGLAEGSIAMPDNQDLWKQLLDGLQSERANHPGVINHTAWDRINRMLLVHSLNAAQLEITFEQALSDEVFFKEVMAQDANPTQRRIRLGSIDQSVHNFLASGYALEKQALIFANAYSGTEFRRRFSKRFDDLNNLGPVAFASDMRSFLTHQTLPFTQQTFSFSAASDEAIVDITISPEELMRNSEWGRAATQFIEDSGEKVELLLSLRSAFENQNIFWSWALRQAYTMNSIDRVLADEIALEANFILTRGQMGRPRRSWMERPGKENGGPRRRSDTSL